MQSNLVPSLRTAVVAGAVAGNLTVAGIRVGDVLVAVQRVDEPGANVVDEFSITADNTINNTGGTSTADQTLLIVWYAKDERGGTLDRS